MPYAPRATFDNPYGAQVTFRTEDVLPPSAFYISPEDQVTVWVLTDTLAQSISVQLRLLMPTGEIKLIPYQFPPLFTFNWHVAYEVPPWEGYLLGAICFSTIVQRGQCFVSVQVMRSAPPSLINAGIVLMQGYINNVDMVSYPTSPLETTFSGRGAFITVTEADQTGVGIFLAVPPNTLWRVCYLTFELITDGTVGNRTVTIVGYDLNSKLLGFWNGTTAQPPSSTYLYSFSCSGTNTFMGNQVTIAGPTDLFLAAQGSVRTSITGLSATDKVTNIVMQVEQWVGV